MHGKRETKLAKEEEVGRGRKKWKARPECSSAYSIFCRSHPSLRGWLACSQAPVQNTLLDVCRTVSLCSPCPQAPRTLSALPALYHPLPIQCTPTPDLGPGERPPAPSNRLRAQQQRRKVLLGCQDHSGTKCTLGYGDNWIWQTFFRHIRSYPVDV